MPKPTIIKVIAASSGLVLLVALIVVAYFAYVFNSLEEAFTPPPPNEYVIHFEEVDETIYLRARSWGLPTNHQEIIVANLPIDNFKPDKKRQFIYLDNTDLYYKKVGIDTLEIHAGILADVPEEFSSKVKVKQVKLDLDDARSYANHYEDKGFSKVSVYPSN